MRAFLSTSFAPLAGGYNIGLEVASSHPLGWIIPASVVCIIADFYISKWLREHPGD